jgi:hypothetical protein
MSHSEFGLDVCEVEVHVGPGGQRIWKCESIWSQANHCQASPLVESPGVGSNCTPCLCATPTLPHSLLLLHNSWVWVPTVRKRLFPNDAWPPLVLFSNSESNLWCPYSLIRLLPDIELDLKQIVAPASDCSCPNQHSFTPRRRCLKLDRL